MQINNLLQGLLPTRYDDFRLIVDQWDSIVGERYSKNSRPQAIWEDKLHINVSHPTLATDLRMKQLQILSKVNKIVEIPLTGVVCTLVIPRSMDACSGESILTQIPVNKQDRPATAIESLNNWRSRIESLNLPQCPKCDHIATHVELSRWGTCSSCAANGFSTYFDQKRCQ
jgi:predicted nucleic acid-binding Zn ribbon protein